ncbi:MAG: putative PEP-binding protein, partial [Polymorphobacter sp.]
SEPWEFDAAKALVEEQRNWLERSGRPQPAKIRYGAMLEVPALAECLDVLFPKIDFLSIGTNDLTQFLFAADRANPLLADRYDWLSPAILRFLRRVVRAADAAAIPVTVCGEMGGRPLEALALAGIGVERLSVTPAAIGPLKAMFRSANLAPIRAAMTGWLDAPGVDVRERLSAAVHAQGIICG